MTDDNWRNSYDAWKLRSPEERSRFDPLCFRCGSEDQTFRSDGDRWLCGDCLDDAERIEATDPDAPYDEADLRDWSEEARP